MTKSKKTLIDFTNISSFLSKMSGLTQMLSNIYENYSDLVYLISTLIKYQKVEANRIIFRSGEKYDSFYIILDGEVSLYIPQESKIEMTEEDFIDYIRSLKEKGEYDIIQRNFFSNKIYGDNSTKKISSDINSKPNFSQKNKNILELIEKTELTSNYNIDGNTKDYINFINKPRVDEYSSDKRKLNIWQYFLIGTLKNGDFFGDSSTIDSRQKRYI